MQTRKKHRHWRSFKELKEAVAAATLKSIDRAMDPDGLEVVVDDIIKSSVRDVVRKTLGVREWGGRYDLDSSSALGGVIREKAKGVIDAMIKPVLDRVAKEMEEDEAFNKKVLSFVRREYRNVVMEDLAGMVRRRAERDLTAIEASLSEDFSLFALYDDDEPADPPKDGGSTS